MGGALFIREVVAITGDGKADLIMCSSTCRLSAVLLRRLLVRLSLVHVQYFGKSKNLTTHGN